MHLLSRPVVCNSSFTCVHMYCEHCPHLFLLLLERLQNSLNLPWEEYSKRPRLPTPSLYSRALISNEPDGEPRILASRVVENCDGRAGIGLERFPAYSVGSHNGSGTEPPFEASAPQSAEMSIIPRISPAIFGELEGDQATSMTGPGSCSRPYAATQLLTLW